MKKSLVFALLAAAAAVALNVQAQDGSGGPVQGADKPEAPAASPRGADDTGQERLYVKLKNGGEAVFKGSDGEASAGPVEHAKKRRYKGYAKKGLEMYKMKAADRLDESGIKDLSPEDAKAAKTLAAEAEFNKDLKETIRARLEKAPSAPTAPTAGAREPAGAEEKGKLDDARRAADEVEKSLAKKMRNFEKDRAGGKKIFKDPAPDAAGKAAGAGGGPEDAQKP